MELCGNLTNLRWLLPLHLHSTVIVPVFDYLYMMGGSSIWSMEWTHILAFPPSMKENEGDKRKLRELRRKLRELHSTCATLSFESRGGKGGVYKVG